MAILREWLRRLWGSFAGSRPDREVEEELRAHLALAEEDARRHGNSADDAIRTARLQAGGVAQAMDAVRAQRGLQWVDAIRSDGRYALRQLRRYPIFSITAVLTLALGIGPNATMITIVSRVFRPLPVPAPEQIVTLATTLDNNPRIGQRLSHPDYVDYKSQSNAFAGIAAWDLAPIGLTAHGQTDRLIATVVSEHYFSTLQLTPTVGRLILPSDGELGGVEPIVVISHAYWMRRFGGDRSVVNQSVRINGRPYTIVGVAPERFTGTFALISSDAYLPLRLFRSEARFANRDVLSVRAFGRLHAGVTLNHAQASINGVTARLEREHSATNAGRRVHVYAERRARPEPQTAAQAPVLALFFLLLVAVVLLISCVNVLGLFLTRALGREREMALRATLGGTRRQLVRLCLVEAFVIAVLGAVTGSGFGFLLVRAAEKAADSPGIPLTLDLRMDWTTWGYVSVLLIASTLIIGIVPALRATRAVAATDLSGGRTSTSSPRRHVIRKGLAIAQMTGSVVLLVVCGLFMRSVQHMESEDLGFDTDRVLLASTDPMAVGYDASQASAFYESLDTALEDVPGVASAASSVYVPFGTGNSTSYVAADSATPPSSTTGVLAENNFITSDYFETIGTTILRGRTFSKADTKHSARVAVVNRAMAARLWPNDEPLGKRFRTSNDIRSFLTVVGVASDARYRLSEVSGPTVPRFFLSLDQINQAGARVLHIRTPSMAPESLAPVIQATIRRVDPAVPVFDVYTLHHQIADSSNGFGGAKGAAMVTGMLGVLAFLLALIGTYGVLSFTVSERTREIGIRLALGFEPRRVFQMFLKETWMIALLAVVIGLMLGVAAGHAMSGFLYGVVPHDPSTILAVVVLMVTISTLVGLVPARRASRVDPAETLRYE